MLDFDKSKKLLQDYYKQYHTDSSESEHVDEAWYDRVGDLTYTRVKNPNYKDFDFNTSSTLYTITFNPPRNSTIVVKNSNNEEIQATSQYIYDLEAGTYTYSVTNNLYNNLNNVTFIVSQDETIDITMNERLNNQPIRSVYSQYYNYISELVNKVFDIENPIFLFFVSFIIGFSLIVLIKRLIGGIL